MAQVFIPALLRDLAEGREQVEVAGATVGEVIENLEVLFPGIEARLCDGGQLRATLAVIVDGEVSRSKLRHKLNPKSKIHFMPALSGG